MKNRILIGMIALIGLYSCQQEILEVEPQTEAIEYSLKISDCGACEPDKNGKCFKECVDANGNLDDVPCLCGGNEKEPVTYEQGLELIKNSRASCAGDICCSLEGATAVYWDNPWPFSDTIIYTDGNGNSSQWSLSQFQSFCMQANI